MGSGDVSLTPPADPTTSPQPVPPDRLKYLEMIQGVVSRMSTSSSTLKGWTVTLVAALMALSARDGNLLYLAVAVIPTLLFGGLDAYYLHLERGYRCLFDRAAACDPSVPLFSFRRAPADRGFTAYLGCVRRAVIWVYYLAVLASIGVALAVFANAPVLRAGGAGLPNVVRVPQAE